MVSVCFVSSLSSSLSNTLTVVVTFLFLFSFLSIDAAVYIEFGGAEVASVAAPTAVTTDDKTNTDETSLSSEEEEFEGLELDDDDNDNDDNNCTYGIPLSDDFDGSDWPKMYRLYPSFPTDPTKYDKWLLSLTPVDPSVLARAGVKYRYIDASGYDFSSSNNETTATWSSPENEFNNDIEFEEIFQNEEYKYADIVSVSGFVQELWEEHFYESTSIRYVLDGSGFFDIRDLNDEWVRIHVTPGDFFEFPSGIDERFTVEQQHNESNTEGDGGTGYIQTMRLHKEEAGGRSSSSSSATTTTTASGIPNPVLRSERTSSVGTNPARNEYVSTYLCGIDPDGDGIPSVSFSTFVNVYDGIPDVEDSGEIIVKIVWEFGDEIFDRGDDEMEKIESSGGVGSTTMRRILPSIFILVTEIIAFTMMIF